MGQILNTPTTLDRYVQSVELDGTRYRIRLRWNRRTSSWYMDLMDLDENGIAMGRRLSPGYFPVPKNVENAPPGTFYVLGKVDPYEREDLGVNIFLEYITAAELAAATVEDEAITVVI